MATGNPTYPTTHGLSSIPEYAVWKTMRARCHCRTNRQFADYGGRGIRVCRRWAKFVNFLADMGRRPTARHTIERRDNDRGYSPENCYWATKVQQGRNKRTNRLVTHGGLTMCLSAWAERLGVRYKTLHNRLWSGMSIDRAFTLNIKPPVTNRSP